MRKRSKAAIWTRTISRKIKKKNAKMQGISRNKKGFRATKEVFFERNIQFRW